MVQAGPNATANGDGLLPCLSGAGGGPLGTDAIALCLAVASVTVVAVIVHAAGAGRQRSMVEQSEPVQSSPASPGPDAVACGPGLIGMMPCPGHLGDLADDLAALAAWGATTLVTCLEATELDRFSLQQLGQAAEAQGLVWHHLPIRDGQVPDARFDLAWLHAGHHLRRTLRRGQRIVLHCHAGLGRTGTVAARLLCELGATPDDALRRVRRARPGAIETPRQEEHVRGCRPVSGDQGHAGRVLGCLLGGAVGDAFGYAVEFQSLAAIRQRYGPDGLQTPVWRDGRLLVSDDTQMTVFTADGLVSAADANGSLDSAAALNAIRTATLTWFETQTMTYSGAAAAGTGSRSLAEHAVLWERRAPGNTCLSACAQGAIGTPETPLNDSKGCGGVMRVAPIGLVSALAPSAAFDLAARAAAQTHGHPCGYLSAGVLAALVRLALDTMTLRRALDHAAALARDWSGADETLGALERARSLADDPGCPPDAAIARLGGGWVGEEALGIAVYAMLRAADYRTCISLAANHDGDSDSTASIAGQLYGAWHGLDGIPPTWVRRLDVLNPLLLVCRGLIDRCGPLVTASDHHDVVGKSLPG